MKKNIIDVSKLDMSKLKSIKNDEINELIPLAQSGDESAREKLIYGNLKFVLSVVKKYNETETKFNDLFQVGCIGLLKSIDGYDVNYGVRFTTYALPKITSEIRRFLRKETTIVDDIEFSIDTTLDITMSQGLERLSERESDIINKRYFEGKTQMEVAEEMGISQSQVSKIEKLALKIIFDDNNN